MSTMIASAQPKTPRTAKQQRPKSAAPSDSDNSRSMQHQNQHQQRTNRRNQRNATPPAWEQGHAATGGQGDFDGNGNYLLAQNDESEDPMYEDMEVISGTKRPSKKQRQKHAPPRQTGAISPPRTNQYSGYGQGIEAPPPAITMTPSKPAYAGPTFHASPAPSALPLPKFFSKSVPAASSQSSMQARLDDESDKSDKSASPPRTEAQPIVPTPPPRQEESPLDFFFKADKEEKAKRKSTGILTTPTSKPVLTSQNSEPGRGNTWNEIYARPSHHTRQISTGAGKGMFPMEMDGATDISPPRLPAEQMSTIRSVTAPSMILQGAPPNMHYNQHNHAQNGHHIYQSPNHGYSMPALPSQPSPPSGYPQPLDQAASPFYRPNLPHTPRSAGSTPIQQDGTYNQQPLHYGNRNLSPVFKAVKQDSVRRASSLRQEVHASSPNFGPAELPDNPLLESPSRRPSKRADQAAMAYLTSQVPSPPTMSRMDLPTLSSSSVPSSFGPPAELPAQPQHQARNGDSQDQNGSWQSSAQNTPPRTTPADVRSMEQDLRRILNLNVFGNTGGVSSVT
jgi:hypothetical protein